MDCVRAYLPASPFLAGVGFLSSGLALGRSKSCGNLLWGQTFSLIDVIKKLVFVPVLRS